MRESQTDSPGGCLCIVAFRLMQDVPAGPAGNAPIYRYCPRSWDTPGSDKASTSLGGLACAGFSWRVGSDDQQAKRSEGHATVFEEVPQLGRDLELSDGLQLLERRGEGVREAPERAWLELIHLRVEVVAVNVRQQVARQP